jgi:hypothetical protein
LPNAVRGFSNAIPKYRPAAAKFSGFSALLGGYWLPARVLRKVLSLPANSQYEVGEPRTDVLLWRRDRPLSRPGFRGLPMTQIPPGQQELSLSSPEETRPMYQTMVLEFIETQCPAQHARLKASHTLLFTAQVKAAALKRYHQTRTDRLCELHPNRDPAQNASQALELALEDLRDDLPCESTPAGEGEGALSLDAAMAYLRSHTPPA